MNLCIIIPAHNESQAIGDLVARIRQKGISLVVIDDGSSDDTGVLAEKNGAVVIRNNSKKGKGVSLQKGFEYALNNQFEGVITMDGDGQHDVGDLDAIIAKARAFRDSIVSGDRMGNNHAMPWVRLMTNRFMSSMISAICKQRIPDTQCGYRYVGAKVLNDIKLFCSDFEVETEVLIEASKKGYQIHSVPIKTIYRNEKSKINPFVDTVRFFIYILKELFAKKRS